MTGLGRPIVAYVAAAQQCPSVSGANELHVATAAREGWIVDNVDRGADDDVALALDACDRPIVAYSTENRCGATADAIRSASWSESEWQVTTVETAYGAGGDALFVDRGGEVFSYYRTGLSADAATWVPVLGRRVGDNWTAESIAEPRHWGTLADTAVVRLPDARTLYLFGAEPGLVAMWPEAS